MDEVWVANKRFKAALDSCMAKAEELDEKERRLDERIKELDREKLLAVETHGNPDAKEEDIVTINAGGKIVKARRATLTQLKGTPFEWLFGGRWEKKLQKDRDGNIFLDVDPTSFQLIVDYLNALAISSGFSPPEFPSCNDGCSNCDSQNHERYFELFGLNHQNNVLPRVTLPDSEIIKTAAHSKVLHSWLSEDGSDGDFRLLYDSSRDGLTWLDFRSKCEYKKHTLTIIETKKGVVVGGYSNEYWTSFGNYRRSNKAFIYCLSGEGVAPTKMKLKNDDGDAIKCSDKCGPVFGAESQSDDFLVRNSKLELSFGRAYECPPEFAELNGTHKIKKMEVFQIIPPEQEARSLDFKPSTDYALSLKEEALKKVDQETSIHEERFKKEKQFIEDFASCEDEETVVLDVSGTIMTTNRSTLRIIHDSVLARQFDDSVWTNQGSESKPIKEWSSHETQNWIKSIDGIPDGVDELLKQKEINGQQLLALGRSGLERILGTERIGVVYLLHENMCTVLKESEEVLIEHSPYCFGKILDFLRLKRLHSLGLVKEPSLPVVHESRKDLFQRVVNFYFPGETSKQILG